MTALKLEEVSLQLGSGVDQTAALRSIDLTVDLGELVAVTGRSGSGKSSLCNVAGGLIVPSVGTVTVMGERLTTSATQLADVRRRHVGYVFQNLNLIANLTVVENVSLPLELGGMPSAQARELADDALQQVELALAAGRFPDELSGGEQQRVAIARGLVGPRNLLIADEPTAALDDVAGEAILRLLRARCDAGAAALMVTHDPSQAAWADRVIRLESGRIISETKAAPTDLDVTGFMK